MKRTFHLFLLFGSLFLLLCCGSGSGMPPGGGQPEIALHYDRLLLALAEEDSTAIGREQCYVRDTLPPDTLLSFPHREGYLRAWVNSYLSYTAEPQQEPAVSVSLPVERFCADVKTLAVRLLDAGGGLRVQEALRPVAHRLHGLGQEGVAAVVAAAAVGIDADPEQIDELSRRLLTRLLLVGEQAPRLSHRPVPSVPGISTLLLFYETGCEECEAVLRDLSGFYPTLRERGVRIISIAADADEEGCRLRAATLPWREKRHERQGVYGPDFEAYGIVSLPTLSVVLPNGRIAGFYRRLEETGLLHLSAPPPAAR